MKVLAYHSEFHALLILYNYVLSCTKVLTKSARIVNHVKKSILVTDRLDQLYGKTLVAKNETRWNSQLKMVRRLLEINVEKVVEKQDLLLTSYEKSILRELVDILEPFEDATDLLQGELYNSISLVIQIKFSWTEKAFNKGFC